MRKKRDRASVLECGSLHRFGMLSKAAGTAHWIVPPLRGLWLGQARGRFRLDCTLTEAIGLAQLSVPDEPGCFH